MAEGNKKSGGNFKAQSAITQGRNKRLKGERHARRMAAQETKVIKVPRGTARDQGRKGLQAAYAARPALAAQ